MFGPSSALFFYPLSAALLYAFAALILKRSSDLGVGLWRTAFIANMIGALVYSSLWWVLGGGPVDVEKLWQPGLIAVCLFGGQISQFLALSRGAVSVAVPIFGLKVIIVGLLTPFLVGESIRPSLWVAAALSVVGVTFMNRNGNGKPVPGLLITVVSGTIGSVCFAFFDLLVQKWGPAWGAGRLLPCVFWINAVLSLGLITQFRAPLTKTPSKAWIWLVGGSLALSLQSTLFVGYIATYGKAAAANIIYSARGLLSVLLVWFIGHWFANQESTAGSRIFLWRLTGAALMLAAIAIVAAG